jgi:membrane protease YdiL (CAAX protease family)
VTSHAPDRLDGLLPDPRLRDESDALLRTALIVEIALVLLLSLGRSAVYAVVNFVAALTQGPLSEQRAVMNRSLAPDRPWLDLVYQLLSIFFAVVPIALAAYLLVLRGGSLRLWWSRRHLGLDAGRGAVIAAAVGSVGLVFYLVTYAVGLNLAVVAQDLDDVWWRYPVLVLAALENAAVEELILLGFVLLRLEQLGMRSRTAVVVVAVLRGCYHLYQGVGGFVGNLVMGLLFGWLFLRWRRVAPFVVAHTLLDVGAFVGYALLAPHVSWLPG